MTVKEIQSENEALQARVAELKRRLALQQELAELEARLLIGKGDAVTIVRTIAETVAQEFGVPLTCISGRSREQQFVVPRHIVLHLAKRHAPASQKAIAKMFGLDHGTVSHALKNIQERSECSREFAERLVQIELACCERIAALKNP